MENAREEGRENPQPLQPFAAGDTYARGTAGWLYLPDILSPPPLSLSRVHMYPPLMPRLAVVHERSLSASEMREQVLIDAAWETAITFQRFASSLFGQLFSLNLMIFLYAR